MSAWSNQSAKLGQTIKVNLEAIGYGK